MAKFKTPTNPFPTSGYYGPVYFCDRESETQKITQLLQNGQSCLLLGNRRLGKTALIHHLRQSLPSNWGFIYLDILPTENQSQLLNSLGSALLEAFGEQDSVGKKVWEFIKGFRPLISFDQLSGLPQVTFQTFHTEKPIADILSFLATLDQPTVIALDEFQQIQAYPEQNTNTWLRSAIQQLQNVFFLFSGSRQSVLHELFADARRPFFKCTTPIKLEKIELEIYRDFIVQTFQRNGKNLSPTLAAEILDWTKRHTYYVQLLCNKLFQVPVKDYAQGDWHSCAQQILAENETFFIHYRTLLSTQQWKLLVAIALAGRAYAPTSKDFLTKYNLGSSATVFKSIDSLLEKDMIYKEYDEDGAIYYEVYDVFFERWIQNTF